MASVHNLEKSVCMVGKNISYIIQEEHLFLDTEYKVMRNQEDSDFVECMRMKYNGDIQLLYLTEPYRSLLSILPILQMDGIGRIVEKILESVMKVRNNGFLNCMNLEISPDKIFVNLSDYSVKFIYLPIAQSIELDDMLYENNLRKTIMTILKPYRESGDIRATMWYTDFSNLGISLDRIYRHMIGNQEVVEQEVYKEDSQLASKAVKHSGALYLTYFKDNKKYSFDIDKDEFYIGKKVEMVDAVIDCNSAISRRHCKILHQNQAYYVQDLKSVNGTFLNGKRLEPESKKEIKHGDTISLANLNLQVVFGKE